MEIKTARLTLLIDPNKKAVFERLCARQDRTASQVVRQLIRDYLAEHDVEYTAAGIEYEHADKAEQARAAETRSKQRPHVAAKPVPASRTGQQRR
jgi:hypothetical protein